MHLTDLWHFFEMATVKIKRIPTINYEYIFDWLSAQTISQKKSYAKIIVFFYYERHEKFSKDANRTRPTLKKVKNIARRYFDESKYDDIK